MRAATVHEIKEELLTLKPAELTGICLKLAKFKKENKELLTFLLFESHNEQGYIENVKREIDELFQEINFSHLYFVKKSLRKILRVINKHVRYMGSKQGEVELLLYFCTLIKNAGVPLEKNNVINNIYQNALKKLNQGIQTMHEDLQYDYLRQARLL